jgi:hypothetical protein
MRQYLLEKEVRSYRFTAPKYSKHFLRNTKLRLKLQRRYETIVRRTKHTVVVWSYRSRLPTQDLTQRWLSCNWPLRRIKLSVSPALQGCSSGGFLRQTLWPVTTGPGMLVYGTIFEPLLPLLVSSCRRSHQLWKVVQSHSGIPTVLCVAN